MVIRIPLVQVNGRIRELSSQDKFLNKVIDSFVFEQLVPSAIWEIEHNMNKFPSISIVQDDGTEVYGLKIYNSSNKITLSFSKPITGKAFLN